MKLLDANLLLLAANTDASVHRDAVGWLEDALSGTETVGFAWMVLLAFLRISTRHRVFPHPLPPAVALDLVDAWLTHPTATIVHPTARHAAVLRGLIGNSGVAGDLVMDAHLAALAIEHGAELYSTDKDFAQFPDLRWRNPLSARR